MVSYICVCFFSVFLQPQVLKWDEIAAKHDRRIPLNWHAWAAGETSVRVSAPMWLDGKLSAAELREVYGLGARGNLSTSDSTRRRRRNTASQSNTNLVDDSTGLIEVSFHPKNVASKACALRKIKQAELPLPLRVQSDGLYFSRKSFDLALAHAPFLQPAPISDSNPYVSSGAAAECAYLFMRRPLIFKEDLCV